MEYEPVNVVTFLIGVGFLANGYRMVRTKRENVLLFVLSVILGTGLLSVALLPNISETVADVLGIEFKANAILITSNLVLFSITIYVLNRMSMLYDNISKLNEELALLRQEVNQDEE